MATNKTLIRSCLLYEYKVGTKVTVAWRKICIAFGDDAVSDRIAQKWFKKFCSRDLSLTDEARSVRPKIIDNEDIGQVVVANSKTTCLEPAERFNVFVYQKPIYRRIKERLKTRGITNMSSVELMNYFGPWYAHHIGKIKVASGNKTVESWAAKNLRVQYYFFTYPSLLKIHGSVELLSELNRLLQNEALIELEMKTLSPAFKDAAKRKWFEEVLINFLHLYEANL